MGKSFEVGELREENERVFFSVFLENRGSMK